MCSFRNDVHYFGHKHAAASRKKRLHITRFMTFIALTHTLYGIHILVLFHKCRKSDSRLQRLLEVSVQGVEAMSFKSICPLKGFHRINIKSGKLPPLGLAWTALAFASQPWLFGSHPVDMKSS